MAGGLMSQVLLVTGGGGVGKTTLSAALAVTAARQGVRTLVVTIDPARRLATALGLEHLGSEPSPLDDEPHLWAAMLDATGSWKAIARRHAPADVADRLVDNPFFEAAAQHFPASQSYASAEEMANYVETGAWDLVVVDTPPSAGGIEFFSAPAEMRDLVGGRLLRWLTGGGLPGRRALFRLTARPALRVAGTVLGSDLLERVAEFLMDLRTTYDGLARRAAQIEEHFRNARTVVVTTADPAPLREAARFYRELPGLVPRPDAVVFNRVLPVSWHQPDSPADGALVENLARWGSEAHRQAEAREEFAVLWKAEVAVVPWRWESPTRLDDLAELIAAAEGLPLETLGVAPEAP
jgi:anion-transporting  ArsA/GET3 family ATPase